MALKWDSSMSVGNETIDSQHKNLLNQINRLVEILSSLDVDMASLRESNHFLYTYINEHFTFEEQYMKKNGFPGLGKHRKVHQGFVKFYQDFQKELRDKMASGSFSSVDIRELLKKIEKYLSQWLVRHIKDMDQEYARYIRSR